MQTQASLSAPAAPAARSRSLNVHALLVMLAVLCAVAVLGALAVYGWDYYILDAASRVESPKHEYLRPSGFIGIKLGMAGLALFVILYTYLIRKRSRTLGKIGKTKHWLNFHVVAGITAPLLITFHSSFKFQGLAGVAYWIMIAVMISGFVGRYLYGQIPRTLSAAEMTLREIEGVFADTARAIEEQCALPADAVARVMHVPSRNEVAAMPLLAALFRMAMVDLSRPFRLAALRRKQLTAVEILSTLGGFRASGHSELEAALALVKRQSWLLTKVVFLEKAQRVFHLWHVVHRPFSYSLIILIVVHIGVVAMLGYF
jgi:TRAP-type C4-dicarboxylate transport system permease small subunit